MRLRRAILLAALGITGLALETSLFGELTLTGTKPELLLLIALSLAITDGPGSGATAGFTLGLLTDLVTQVPAGVSALAFTIAGYVAGSIRAHLQSPSAWWPSMMISSMTILTVLFYGGFSLLLGEPALPATRILRHALLAGVYNALLTPLLFPLIRGLSHRTRPVTTEVMR